MAGLLTNEKYKLYYQRLSLYYKKPEIRASLEVLLSIFAVIILSLLAIRPTLTNISTLRKKIADQEVVSKKADNKISQLINAQKQLNLYSDKLYLFDRAVPDVFSYSEASKRIEYLAYAQGVEIESLSFMGKTLSSGKTPKGDFMEKIAVPDKNGVLASKVSFLVSGKPDSVIGFLKRVEKMDLLAGIENVSLAKELGQSKEKDTIKASGTISFYFYQKQ